MGASVVSWWPQRNLSSTGRLASTWSSAMHPGSNIHSFGESIWWSVVTVNCGYGDDFPVTTVGRITAVLVMGIGVLTLAVVTAQVASSFVDQAARRAGSNPQPDPETNDTALAAIDRRLAQIEDLLITRAASVEAPARPPEASE